MQIKIAIATNINFYKSTLPIVIQSLLDAGLEKSQLFVFNGGYPTKAEKVIDDITYYELDHNSFEYSPLIEICERQLESEYWFLIHDTCKVGPMFKSLLYNVPSTAPDKIALRTWPSMSIGLYKYSYLLAVKDKILSAKNTDSSRESLLKWKLWGVGSEDYILWQTEPAPLRYNTDLLRDQECLFVDFNNWYGSDTTRMTEYYPSLDLYKNKSNWGQSTGENMFITV